jgi:hypothetical protein
MKLSWRKFLLVAGMMGLLAAVFVLVGCSGDETENAVTEGPEEDCAVCHNDSDQIVFAKSVQWETSGHGEGTSYVRGTSASCAGCHAGGGFTAMIAGGTNPEGVQEGQTNPTPQNCRTCHEIHTTYTDNDWALTTTEPVTLFASGQTYDGGKGNLCANCHQPRREMEAENGMVNWSSTHYGPHHGPQSAMLLGIGGAGATGKPSAHYNMVEDTCVTCHLVNEVHTMAPNVESCLACHADAEDFDINGLQSEIDELIEELRVLLGEKHMLETSAHEPYHTGMPVEDLHPVVGDYTEAEAAALWNYTYIFTEDSSHGVHNPSYTKALLEYSIEALQ